MTDLSEYVNPEPPPEIATIEKVDLIGNTVFSKPWLCKLLLELLKLVGNVESSEIKSDDNEDKKTCETKELDPDFEKDLCDLWDMTVEKDVCLVLDELNSIEIFEEYIKKFNQIFPRAIEIIIGILVNMATMSLDLSLKLVKTISLIQYLFFKILGQMEDVQSVIQTINLFTIFLSDKSNQQIKSHLINFFKQKIDEETTTNWNGILDNYLFILDQSLNPILLDSATNFLFHLLDADDEHLIQITVNENLVEAICNAAMTRLKLERVQKTFNHSDFTNKTDDKSTLDRNYLNEQTPTSSLADIPSCNANLTTQFSEEEISTIDSLLNKYFLCLQTISTYERGVQALFIKIEIIKQLFNEYLDKCLVTFNDWEIRTSNSLKASFGEESMQNLLCLLSILNCIFSNQEEKHFTGSLIEFLIKLLSFCKQYVILINELKNFNNSENSIMMALENWGLIKTNLQELFEFITTEKKYDSYQFKRLISLISDCKNILND